MSKTKVANPMAVVIKEDLPVVNLVNEVIVRSAATGANTICFLPEKDSLTVFCSDGKRVIPIQIMGLEKGRRVLFFSMISRIKVMLHMRIAERKISQSASLEKSSSLPSFTATTVPTEFGESILISLPCSCN